MNHVQEVHQLVVLAESRWPGPDDDAASGPPALPGFVLSSFNPLAAVVADRCLEHRQPEPDTAILLVSEGDRTSAEHVHQAVADGKRVGPLFFFQSVPNSVAGHIAAKWNLRGPVVCLTPGPDARRTGLDEAALLIGDGDAGHALIVLIAEHTAEALLVSGREPR